MRGLPLCLALVVLAAGCDPRETTLVVQVRTDLVPGRDFAEVRVTPDFAPAIHTASGAEREWGDGVRVAELAGLAIDEARLEVAALDAAGAVVVARPVRSRLEGGVQVVTVLLTRACGGVVCPGADDAPDALACVAGRCVAAECAVERADVCGPAECASDGECSGGSACAPPRCVGGACFLSPEHGACASDEVCDVVAGCVRVGGIGPFAPRGAGHALLTIERSGRESRVMRFALDGSGGIEDVSALISPALGRPTTDLFDSKAGVSPNGRWISLVDADQGLVRVDVDGVVPTQYILRETLSVQAAGTAISDAGSEIVYVDATPAGSGLHFASHEGGVWRASGRDLTELSAYAYHSEPRWHGSELVFRCSAMSYFDAGVCAMAASGGAVRELHPPATGGDVYLSGPTVEASGSVLFALTERASATSRVFRSPTEGGPATPITSFTEYTDPCALADGRWLVLDSGPPWVLVLMQDDAPQGEIPVEEALPAGVTQAYLTGCSP